MKGRSRMMLALAAGLTFCAAAVPAEGMALASPARSATVASSGAAAALDRGDDPSAVLALAQRCIDARHVSLVRTALRRGRVFTLAEARGWCVVPLPALV